MQQVDEVYVETYVLPNHKNVNIGSSEIQLHRVGMIDMKI